MLYWKQILDKKGGNVGKNQLVYCSLYRGYDHTSVTVVRDKYRRQYERPTHASLERLCAVVGDRVALGAMGLYLWPEGFWANVLSGRC